jgi:SUMO ligase MMS21 Smc5/6 complex component
MKIGDVVKFKKPINPEEEKARFILVEGANAMGRVKIELICSLSYKPIELVAESEVEMA